MGRRTAAPEMVPAIHRSRYNRYHYYQHAPETIAKSDGVRVETVKESIAIVESYRAMCTLDELEASQVDTIIGLEELERQTLRAALSANKTVVRDGKDVVVPDFEIRFQAIEKINEKMKAIQPRGRGANYNFGKQIIQPPAQQQPNAPTGVMMYEERVQHAIRRRQDALSAGKVAEPVTIEGESGVPAADETIEGSPAQRPVPR